LEIFLTLFVSPFLDRDVVASLRKIRGLLGRELMVFREVASTNDMAFLLAERGCQPGLVVCAESQSAGRGQFGRSWHSKEGLGLWVSLLVDYPDHLTDSSVFTWWAAVALAGSLSQCTAVPIAIKAPNDLYHAGKKIGGILVETRLVVARRLAVVGFGINVSHNQSDFPEPLRATATSLSLALGNPPPPREAILASILDAMEMTRPLLAKNASALYDAYRQRVDSAALTPSLPSIP
jgi:BirA family biotin operon repressor/biotin-[acetyl-CoA-carboxylase] ligase